MRRDSFVLGKGEKRNGELEDFSPAKITKAIYKALGCLWEGKRGRGRKLTGEVLKLLPERVKSSIPEVEEIQDTVEEVLMREVSGGSSSLYSLPGKRRELREAKQKLFGVKDDLKLSLNAVQVLQERYLLRDEEGRIIETPRKMMKRVARAVAGGGRSLREGCR